MIWVTLSLRSAARSKCRRPNFTIDNQHFENLSMAAFGPMRRAAGAVEGCLAMLRQAQHDKVDKLSMTWSTISMTLNTSK